MNNKLMKPDDITKQLIVDLINNWFRTVPIIHAENISFEIKAGRIYLSKNNDGLIQAYCMDSVACDVCDENLFDRWIDNHSI